MISNHPMVSKEEHVRFECLDLAARTCGHIVRTGEDMVATAILFELFVNTGAGIDELKDMSAMERLQIANIVKAKKGNKK